MKGFGNERQKHSFLVRFGYPVLCIVIIVIGTLINIFVKYSFLF